MKIHPSSSLCDKKLPAIVYDELVRSRPLVDPESLLLAVADFIPGVFPDLHFPDLRPWSIFHTQKFHSGIDCDEP